MPDEKSTSILDECWEWSGSRTADGYGRRNSRYTHRLAWAWSHWDGNGTWQDVLKTIPKGMHVLHRCDNPPCCNPDHLFLGTQADNNHDSISKGRHSQSNKSRCFRGHEFTPENTRVSRYIGNNGSVSYRRHCRTCRHIVRNQWRDGRRALGLTVT